MNFGVALAWAATVLAATLLLGGCGLKGDLYLPENKPANAAGTNAATVPEEFTDNPPLPEPEGTGQSVDTDPAAAPAAAAGAAVEQTVQEEAEQDAAEAPDKDAAADDGQSDAGKETAAEPEA